MSKTTQLLMRPAPGTIVKPVYVYDEGQKEKLQALREVSLYCFPAFDYDSKTTTHLPSYFFFSLLVFEVRLLAPSP